MPAGILPKYIRLCRPMIDRRGLHTGTGCGRGVLPSGQCAAAPWRQPRTGRILAGPDVIVSDGPYGLGSYPGDPTSSTVLPNWYEPHVQPREEA